ADHCPQPPESGRCKDFSGPAPIWDRTDPPENSIALHNRGATDVSRRETWSLRFPAQQCLPIGPKPHHWQRFEKIHNPTGTTNSPPTRQKTVIAWSVLPSHLGNVNATRKILSKTLGI